MKFCIGFGKYERICGEGLTKNDNPHWCKRCDKLRREHITRQLENILHSQGKEEVDEKEIQN